jgi:hypothetical protein
MTAKRGPLKCRPETTPHALAAPLNLHTVRTCTQAVRKAAWKKYQCPAAETRLQCQLTVYLLPKYQCHSVDGFRRIMPPGYPTHLGFNMLHTINQNPAQLELQVARKLLTTAALRQYKCYQQVCNMIPPVCSS